MDIEMKDNVKIAESVSEHIHFDTLKSFLVKPLDPVMVSKEFSKPVEKTQDPVKDKDGIEAKDYDDVETEVKEVESDYRKGVVLKVPLEYQNAMNNDKYPVPEIHVGDVVIYRANSSRWFDQLKDSQIIDMYSIFAIER